MPPDNLDRNVNYTLPIEGETGSLTSNVNITIDLQVLYCITTVTINHRRRG